MESQNKIKTKISNKKKKTVILFRGKRTLFLSNYRERKSVFLNTKNFSTKSFSLFKGLTLRKIVLAVFVLTISLTLIFKDFQVSEGATYTWNQTDWSGGALADTADHTNNRTGWTKYASKDADVTVANAGADLQLTSTAGSKIQTTTADFAAGTNSQTVVDTNSVILAKTTTPTFFYTDIIPTDVPTSSVSSVIGSDGFARITYHGNTDNDLEFIQCTSTDCSTNIMTTVDSVGDVGEKNSIAIGSDGFARISYVDTTNNSIKFAQCTNASCSTKNITTVDSPANVGLSNSFLAIGSDGFARITYVDTTTNSNLKFAQCTNASCSTKNITTIASSFAGWSNSLAIGLDGFARISYYDGAESDLEFVKCTNATCSTKNITTVDSTGSVGMYHFMTLGSDGFARISYVDTTNSSALKFVQCTNDFCSTRNINTIDATASSGNYSSLKMGSDDRARIAYSSGSSLQFVWCTNGSCSLKNVTTYTRNGSNLTLSLIGSDNLAMVSALGSSRVRFIYQIFPYYSSGIFTSSVINLGQKSNPTTLTFNKTTPAGTTLTIDARAGNTATPDGTWTDWVTNVSSGGDISSLTGNQYFQYRANLAATDTKVTPTLDDVTVNYNYYPSSATLTSSVYNTENAANTMAKLMWTENLPTDTDVKFQVQTSSDNVTWTGYFGPDGTSGTYFTDPTGGEAMPSAFQSGSDDQYFQYKAYLSTTNGSVTPTLSDVSTYYVVNAPPEFDATYGTNGLNISQISNSADSNYGKVQIQYSIRDIDTSTGSFTPDYVTPTFEYTLDGTNYEDVDLAKVTFGTAPDGGGYSTYSGKTTNKVSEGSYLTYTAYWDAKTQTGLDGSYSDNFKIRMTINDNESANNTAVATSAVDTLDVENPTLGAHPILVNGSVSVSNVSLSASDESGIQMKVGLESNLSDVANWEAYSATKTITLVDVPETIYVQFRDAYGNVSAILSAITPEIPPSMMIQDTSNLNSPEPHEYRLFVAWKKIAEVVPAFGSYEVYRSESASGPWGSPIATILSRNTNYYGDSVAANTTFYYKVRTIDVNGNISDFSTIVNGSANGIQDGGEGGGGSDLTPPSVSSVLSASVTTNSALITWSTNEFATSTVGFSDSAGNFETEMGVDGYEETHSVLLTGLTPETNYYFQIKSADAIGNLTTANNGGLGYEFATLPGPAISNISIKETSNFQSTISWITSTDSNTVLTYAASLDNNGAMIDAHTLGDASDLVGGSAPFTHEQIISELTEGTKYYFFVKSVDAEDNEAIDNNGGEFYEFTTLSDNQDPVLSSISAVLISNSGAAIHWVTDEQASSQVQYRKAGDSSYTSTAASMVLGKDHYVIISALDSNTEYEYRVVSEDINGNDAISGIATFETLSNPEFQHEPLSEITDITNPPSIITDNKAVITFNTDQPAKCAIEYGTATGSYSEVPFVEASYNQNHSIHVTGLIFSTIYFYKITCLDNLGTSVESDEYSFTTIAQIDDGTGEGEASVPPEISGIGVGTITGESATVTWKTDKVANSLIRFGITTEYGNMAGNDLVNSLVTNYVTDHTVIINNLIPSTKYFYKVLSVDATGNIAESAEETFTTKAPSSLSSIKFVSTSLNEVTATWTTGAAMTSVVEYGITTDYGDSKSSSSSSKEHSIQISGLKSGTVYHFRVKGEDADNNIYSSGDYTFEPKSPPKVSNAAVTSTTEHGAKISVTTDIPTDILVTYFEKNDPTNSGSQGKPDFSTSHNLELSNLKSGTTYSYTIKVSDEQGNQTTGEAREFTTDKDENPPKISQIKTDGAIAQNDKVQMIISWTTDEPATTAFIYREGMGGEEKEILVSEAFTQSHTVVSTIFKSGTVYYFKTKSIDQAENETISSDFALLTPKKKENIVQIIVNNFQDIFGWAKVLQ